MSKSKGLTTSTLVKGDFKPCPFCGGEPVVMRGPDGFTSAGCLRCNPAFGVMMQGGYATVRKRWNTRIGEEGHAGEEA